MATKLSTASLTQTLKLETDTKCRYTINRSKTRINAHNARAKTPLLDTRATQPVVVSSMAWRECAETTCASLYILSACSILIGRLSYSASPPLSRLRCFHTKTTMTRSLFHWPPPVQSTVCLHASTMAPNLSRQPNKVSTSQNDTTLSFLAIS